MAGCFEQNLNFSLFYQNLIKIIFYKNSKRIWLKKIQSNKKWSITLISKQLVALNLGGLKREKKFQVTTKSRFFFLEALITGLLLGTQILTAKCSKSSNFGQFQGRFKKKLGPGIMRDVYSDFFCWP
jgi:hypothetical protein